LNKASLALLLIACAASPSTPSGGLDSLVRAPITDKVYPGISVAVGNSVGLLAAGAFGHANIAAATFMTPQTPMRVASVSKTITAAAILMLDQAGAISIDKPVSTYGPQFTSNGARITLRQLLAHISGIPGRNHGDPILHGDGPIRQAQFFTKAQCDAALRAAGHAMGLFERELLSARAGRAKCRACELRVVVERAHLCTGRHDAHLLR
jgi:CubicO group peptidase (beta-lactamase class C family)